MRKLIYTINFGRYDPIRKPLVVTPGWDYVCVTDFPRPDTGWNIMAYNNDMPRWLIAREVYIKHSKFFPDYDLSIMIGGQYDINCDLDEFLEGKLSDSADMAIMQHPERFCVYDEIHACVVHGKIRKPLAGKIADKYKNEGIPKREGMIQAGIIIRKHDRPNLDKFNDLWFEETKFTTRDQISFMYTYHKHKIISYNTFSAYECDKQFIHNRHNDGT